MNLDPATKLGPRDATWGRVRGALRRNPAWEHHIGPNADELTNCGKFAYIDALSNHLKHRSLVGSPFAAELDIGAHGLRFREFEYEGPKKDDPTICYPAEWVDPTLWDELQRQSVAILGIGNTLNALVADAVAHC